MSKMRSARVPINPDMLRWAREWAGFTISQASHHLKVPNEKIEAWESGNNNSFPTVRQGRILADYYGRSFLEFFRNNPPPLPSINLVPDFRLYRDSDTSDHANELKKIQIWAESKRLNALELFSETGESTPIIPDSFFTSIDSDHEEVSNSIRSALNFSIETQTSLRASEQHKLPNILREIIESIGVMTIKFSALKNIRVRGLCLAEFPLPVIMYGKESPSAQAFTLVHEFAHILLRQSAIIGPMSRNGGYPGIRKIEEWCNRFAASFLIPKKEVFKFIALSSSPLDEISDEILGRIARHFGVSEHATLIRLVHLDLVKPRFYWDIKKSQYDEAEKNYKHFGKAKYYASRYKSSLGNLYTSIVLDAWAEGKITNHNAAEYMDIKNLSHLNDIRERFGI